MYSRRHLRVKVLQTLYAYQQSEMNNLELGEKMLLKNAEEMYQMYWQNLLIISDLCEFTNKYADFEDGKMLATVRNEKLDRKFAHNIFAVTLNRNEQFTKQVKGYNLHNNLSTEMMRDVFVAFIKSEEYQNYLQSAENSVAETVELVQNLYRNYLLKNTDVESQFEETSILWQSDKEHVRAAVLRTIKSLGASAGTEIALEPISQNWTEDRSMLKNLFKKCVLNHEAFATLIEQKAQNWEADRIAPIDRLLIVQALCEMVDFENIPVKVTINEYLEIAKVYSTPKSKTFINGVLDAIAKDLIASGKIVKSGRGLV